MILPGEWSLCEDGVTRPILRASVMNSEGGWTGVEFLIDTGADRTVLIWPVVLSLGLTPGTSVDQLSGLGGTLDMVPVRTTIRLHGNDEELYKFVGDFPAVRDDHAMDMCVVGRDILNCFALYIDYFSQQVLLIGEGHKCQVTPV